jgi:predicted nucleotidyltransferase
VPADSAPAEDLLAEAVRAYVDAFGDRLVAAYALGSLAHGGFSPLVSDVDLGLVLADPLAPADADAVERVAATLRAGGSSLHERLSVFWGTPATLRDEAAGGRFPPLDRLDLIQHGRLLRGTDVRAGLPQPSRADLLVAGAEFALVSLAGERDVEAVRRPETLYDQGVPRVTKLVLFPVRFLYSAETGLVGTNHAAVEHYLAAGGAPGVELVAGALGWRISPPDRAHAIDLLRRELIPLYLHYLDDHAARLRAAGRPDLAAAFVCWRGRIAA